MYTMKTKPWMHQVMALDYLMTGTYGALYTDMGTGKTKVGIDLIVNKGFNLTVIVGTKKSCGVWESEFIKHCDLNRRNICVFNLSNYSTSNKILKLQEILAYQAKTGVKIVLIINYDSIWRRPFNESLIKTRIDCVICDESHRIKTPSSKCSIYLARLGKCVKYRYLMTGTPTTETPVDVYAQYKFLQPEIFGTSLNKFRSRYENLDVRATTYCGYRVLDKKQPYKNLDELREKMFSCAFYAKSTIKLPPQTFLIREFTPTKTLINVYKEVKKEGVLVDEDGIMETNNALVKILRQQQILSGYLPMESEDFTQESIKVLDNSRQQAFIEILEEINKNEPIVVFTKFRYDFERIKEACEKNGRRYAELSGIVDEEAKWKNGDADVLAVQYKTGSESIDLTRARYCIYYSLSHSYGLYKQSIKRVHRPNQTRPVTYISLVAKIPKIRTVDEDIITALGNKQDVAEYLLKKA